MESIAHGAKELEATESKRQKPIWHRLAPGLVNYTGRHYDRSIRQARWSQQTDRVDLYFARRDETSYLHTCACDRTVAGGIYDMQCQVHTLLNYEGPICKGKTFTIKIDNSLALPPGSELTRHE